jgi:DNA-binding NtrC family response regulator
MSRILVIEDDAGIRQNILDMLEAEGFDAVGAPDGESGVALAVRELPDLVICDIAMPGIDGYDVFEHLSTRPATAVIPFIFLSARAERAEIRRGMALGADDYLTKPFSRVELLDSIRARIERRRVREGGSGASTAGRFVPHEEDPPDPAHLRPVASTDPAMVALYAEIDRIAASPLSVLILGETGAGKEILAEEIHRRSGRRGPFVPLNCAALTESLLESELFGHEKGAFTGAIRTQEGVFESAASGTLFLDEVGELPAATQAKLLRVLEERKVTRVGGRVAHNVDVRFLSATNRDVAGDIERGAFRQDLYFRLNGISLHLPALRDRRGDIAPIARRFVAEICRTTRRTPAPLVSDAALAVLEGYRWPGNIRELRNVIERAVLLCDGTEILPSHLPSGLTGDSHTRSNAPDPRARLVVEMERLERERTIEALARCAGNQTQAAQMLGISRRTLVTRLNQYDLPRPRKKGA